MRNPRVRRLIGVVGAVVGLGQPDQPVQPKPPEPYKDPDSIRRPGPNNDGPKDLDKDNKDNKDLDKKNVDKKDKLIVKVTDGDVNTILNGWPAESKKAAQAMITKYGQPDGAMPQALLWDNAGPWKRVLVYGHEHQHNFPRPHKDVLHCFVDMKVPADMFDDLARFDGSLICARTQGEVSAMCDSEEMNFAAINLAHDIVQGSKTVEQAREALAKTAMSVMQGTKDPITQDFRFPLEPNTADADQPGANPTQRPGTP